MTEQSNSTAHGAEKEEGAAGAKASAASARCVKKRGMEAQDYVALAISLLALAVSAMTAYWGIVRQVDDVRLLREATPQLVVNQDKILAYASDEMTFINLGNRPAAVTSVDLAIVQDDPQRCTYRDGLRWSQSIIKPFVMKPGEMAVQTPGAVANPFSVPVKDTNAKKITVSLCALFYIVTPDNPVDLNSMELITAPLQPKGNNAVVSAPVGSPVPESLVYHWHTVFLPRSGSGETQ